MPLLDDDDQEYAKRKLFFLTNFKPPEQANQIRKKAQFYKSNPNLEVNLNELQEIEFDKRNSNLTKLSPNYKYLSNYEIEHSLDSHLAAISSSQDDQEYEVEKDSDFLIKTKKFPNFIKKHIFKENSIRKPKTIVHSQVSSTKYPLNRFNSFTNLNQSQQNHQQIQKQQNIVNNNYQYHDTFNNQNNSSMNNVNNLHHTKDIEYSDYQKRLNKTSEVWHKSKFLPKKSN